MQKLEKGKFFGNSRKEFHINGLTIVDSEFYQYTFCPWHYHQNAHFAFTTRGHLVETHKKKELRLAAGCLLYNHSQEPHCNAHYSEQVAALHVDIDAGWFGQYHLDYRQIEGLHEINNPVQKNIFHRLFKEIKNPDSASPLAIEALLLQAVSELIHTSSPGSAAPPSWVRKINDLLYDRYSESLTLQEVAREIHLHPVYLCQKFPLYFHCTFGDYIRRIRIEKAIELMLRRPQLSLTQIGYACGFADQSHFIRLFRKHLGLTPSAFSRLTRPG